MRRRDPPGERHGPADLRAPRLPDRRRVRGLRGPLVARAPPPDASAGWRLRASGATAAPSPPRPSPPPTLDQQSSPVGIRTLRWTASSRRRASCCPPGRPRTVLRLDRGVQQHRPEGRSHGPAVREGSGPAPPRPDGPSLRAARRQHRSRRSRPTATCPRGARRTRRCPRQTESSTSSPARHPSVSRRPSRAGSARAATRRRASRSCAVHDGSCFDALQVVAPATLANYDAEVLHLTAGCAVTVRGTVAESQGKGQSVEIHAESVEVVGWVDDPDTYPISPKRHTFEYLREVGAPALADQHLRRRRARPAHAGDGDPPLLRRARLRLDPHADHHRQRRRGRRRAVPRVHPRPGQPAADARRRRSTSRRTSSASRPS